MIDIIDNADMKQMVENVMKKKYFSVNLNPSFLAATKVFIDRTDYYSIDKLDYKKEYHCDTYDNLVVVEEKINSAINTLSATKFVKVDIEDVEVENKKNYICKLYTSPAIIGHITAVVAINKGKLLKLFPIISALKWLLNITKIKMLIKIIFMIVKNMSALGVQHNPAVYISMVKKLPQNVNKGDGVAYF